MIAPFSKPAHYRRKKPGRHKGHPGVRRSRPEQIDQHHTHTLARCPDCGQALDGKVVRRYQRMIEDIPPVAPEVHLHTIEGHWCGHCRKIVTPTLTDALPGATLGVHVLVFSAWLHYLLGMSVGQVVRVLSVAFAFPVTAGGLTQAWARLAEQLSPYYAQIEQQVRASGVLHADETSWRVNGRTHWLWAFCTERFCYFLIDRHRSAQVVAQVLGEWFDGILICDFYAAYNAVEAWAKQRCLFHLFAELRRVDKRNTSAGWRDFRRRLSRLFKDAMRLKTQQPGLDPDVYQRRKRRLHRRLDALIDAPFADADAVRLRERLANFRGELLTFLDHAAVVPTNNLGERSMRIPVTARKVCQQNRSERGARTHAVLLSLFRTAELQGHHPVQYFMTLTRAAIAGQPLPLDLDGPLKQAA